MSPLGLSFIAAATLLLQVSWTRVLSVTLWYHFAFLVVSTAMLGFGISSVVLMTSSRLRNASSETALPRLALAQAGAVALSFFFTYAIPFAPFSLAKSPVQLIYGCIYVASLGLPYVFSGLIVGKLLSDFPSKAGKLYAYDLIGAACGCALFPIAVGTYGAMGCLWLSCALALAGGSFFVATRRHRFVLQLCGVVLAIFSMRCEKIFPIPISADKRDGHGAMQSTLRGPNNLYSAWNTFSRIDVLPAPWGRRILIDAGAAMTRMPQIGPNDLNRPVTDERRIVLDRPGLSALVIGSGGGWEVAALLQSRARHIVAIEINPLINDLVTKTMAAYVGTIFDNPRVTLVTDEARSYIRRTTEKFDLMMASHTVSNAATAAGALSLTEDFVFTADAFVDYLQHLNPQGRLWISRPESQLPRLVSTIRQALTRVGIVSPNRHMIVFADHPPDHNATTSFYGGVIVSRAPLQSTELSKAKHILREHHLRPLYPGTADVQNIYTKLLDTSAAQLDQLYQTSTTRLDPTTDDRPYFNQRTKWKNLSLQQINDVFSAGHNSRIALEDRPIAEVVLVVLLAICTLFCLVFIAIPMLRKRTDASQHRTKNNHYIYLFFGAIGLGFMFVELISISRLTLFIGQPTHAFVIALGGILVGSGIGSAVSPHMQKRAGPWIPVLSSALSIAAFHWICSSYLPLFIALPLAARLCIALLLIVVIAIPLGTAFPIGLQQATSQTSATIPETISLCWGINAIASVIGSILAIMLATMIGLSGVLYCAIACYLIAALTLYIVGSSASCQKHT